MPSVSASQAMQYIQISITGIKDQTGMFAGPSLARQIYHKNSISLQSKMTAEDIQSS